MARELGRPEAATRALAAELYPWVPLQVLRYRSGQQYRPHLDSVAGDANQRRGLEPQLIDLSNGFSEFERRAENLPEGLGGKQDLEAAIKKAL